MQVNQELTKAISVKEIYLEQGIDIASYGTIGLRCDLRSSNSDKTSPACILNLVCMGSYNFLRDFNLCSTIIGNYSTLLDGTRILGKHDMSRLTTSYCAVLKGTSEICFFDFQGGAPLNGYPCTVIGSDVWIGPDVMMVAGLVIGHGAVIEPGTILTKNVPPYAVVGGRPGKFKGWRFPRSIIEQSLKSRWYLYDWRGVDLPWSEPEKCLTRMSEYIAKHQLQPLSNGYRYDVDEAKGSIRFNPSVWTLESQMFNFFKTSDINELLSQPKFSSCMLATA